jgi:signal transduction histidine kinase
MIDTAASAARGSWQSRLTVANLLTPLRVRLPLLVALVVTLVVGAAGYLELRVFESTVTDDLLETARFTAQTVADDIEIGEDPTRRADLAEGLRDFTNTNASIRAISVVTVENDTPVLVASTSYAERREALNFAATVMARHEVLSLELSRQFRIIGVPVKYDGRVWGAAVLTYSLASVEELRRQGRTVMLWFVPAAIVLLTVLLDLSTRRLIHRPIAGIRRTMRRVKAGDLGARAPVARNDEIGAVAVGLNEMLSEMEGFNVALRERVDEATAELRAKNEELVETYQRLFTLREALARADQLATVGHMAASVAHQVGTPLNLISGYVQLIREDAGRDSRVTRRLEIVEEQIGKVTAIVRTLLDHARRPTPRQPTDPVQIVRRVVDMARPKADTVGVRLEQSLADVAPVMADAVQLELALVNLVANSLDAMPKGGVTSVTVGPTPEGHVRIEVADTGSGIAPDLLPRIFEPWVTTKEAGRGTGLGLSITRDVVVSLGGTITVKSEVGAGSTFTVELPAAPAVAA